MVTGTDLEASENACRMARRYKDYLYATAGLHPHHASQFSEDLESALTDLARRDEVVAVGECGLDYFRNYSDPSEQLKAFERQLEIAVRVGKPVFLHQRDAHDDFIAVLRNQASQLSGGVAHCFTGDASQAEQYLSLGMHIGVTGWVCDDRRGDSLRSAVPAIPLDRLLIETDAPYLLPRDLPEKPRARRNEPSYLAHVAASLATLLDISTDALAEATTRNARALFSL
jgi:TatD DNase family protein